MILKEIKQIKDLSEEDVIFARIGNLSKLGTRVNEKIIKILAKGNTSYIPVLKKEEDESYETLIKKINEEILNDELNYLREKLIDNLKDVYKPFKEDDPIFFTKGKKPLMKINTLMEAEPNQIYWKEILEGSLKILPRHKIISLQKILLEIYHYFDVQKLRTKENLNDKKTLKKLYLYSARRDYEFYKGKVKAEGDSILLHSVDTTIYFLITIANLNKIRSLQNAPRSTIKFFLDKNEYTEFTEFFYVEDIILQASLGSLLHSIGLMHITILENIGNKISLKDKNLKEQHKLKIEHLEKNVNIAKNLFRTREDISAITKMIINGQKDYLDATGYPQLKTNKFIHELVRIFCVIDTYDELVNPIIIKESANPLEAIKFLIENSGKYYWNKEEPSKQAKNKKFDIKMLENFLTILAPFDYGQIVRVAKENNNENLFQAAVIEYKMNILPNLSIINKKNQTYKIEEIIMDLENKEILIKDINGNYKKNPLKMVDDFVIKNNIQELNKNEIQLILFNYERKPNPTIALKK
ncbi:HD domain-containing phosphohydrolase [Borreliella sinica]|uniref:HD domain-containing phosphohydrolase n=1 Tax=Borreliella sinica TaxID=87162 RepID=UPI002A23D611|nr:HD domain-containing phosphohydrolase [Borreliella sinica]WPM06094.1 hypothetical protein QIA41_03265 [Borreliella sinica]